jgi:hypothetical protein
MAKSMPPTQEQSRQLNRQLTEKVLDRAQSDPQWKQQLLDDPEAAMRSANFPETQQLQQMQASAASSQEGEVRGQWWPGGGGGGRRCYWTWYCIWWTWDWWRDDWD